MSLSLLIRIIVSRSKYFAAGLIFFVFGINSASVFAADPANVTAIQTAVTAYKTIGTLRKEVPINGDAIGSAYAGALQALVKEVDTANKLKLDSDILAAIDEIKSANEPALAGQVIDKTLQRVFYQIIFNRISDINNQFKTAASADLIQKLDETVASFQAITANVARANQVLSADKQSIVEGSNPGADIAFNESVARIRAALNKSNPAEDAGVVAVERYVTRISSVARAYYNAVLREVAGAMAARNTDEAQTRNELKEGEVFYRTIESLIARDNPVGNLFIKARLTGNGFDLVADEIVSELNKGMLGRSRGEMANIAKAADRPGRMAEASGTVEFAKIFMPDLELRLGATVRGSLETALNDLNSAVKADDAAKSASAQAAITAIFDNYESQLNLTKYSATSDTVFVDNAVAGYQAISGLLAQNPIDANAVAAKYTGELQQVTQFVDSAYGLTSDKVILAAIDSIRNGNQVSFSAIRIDRSLQQVFALGIYNRITFVLDSFDSLATNELALEWDRAHSASQALIAMTSSINKVLTGDKLKIQDGINPDLDDQITLAFINGREALNKVNADDHTNVAIARENIVIPLVRSFLNDALKEIGELVTNRDGDADKAAEEKLEAALLYGAVETFIAQDNPSGNGDIKAQLTGDLANVNANKIVIEISKGVIGQVRRNISQIESAFGVDKDQAIISAERVSLYANIFLPDLELRLGSLQRAEMQNALQDLSEAIGANDSSKATVARSTITEIVSDYEKELI
jgi:hypothetical protein